MADLKQDAFSNLLYNEQLHLAEGELSAFLQTVTDMFGPEQARLAEADWLSESDLMDSPPVSANRDWHAVTVAASARLEDQLHIALSRYADAASRSNVR